MKRFIIYTLLAVTLGAYSHVQAQFMDTNLGWGLSAGGAHGANANNDAWGMNYRGYFQSEIASPMLTGQVGLGYSDLDAPGLYSAQTGSADLRLLFSPFSLPNLNPYLYGGIGVSKSLDRGGTDLLAMVPLGAGVQTNISNGILLDISGGYYLSLSDKLDARARSNTNLNSLTNQKHDGFYGFAIGLAFSLGSSRYDARQKSVASAEALRIKNEGDAQHAKELKTAEARRVQDSTSAAVKAANLKEVNVAKAQRIKDSTDAAALLVRVKGENTALAQHVKDSTEAEARRIKAVSDAEALRLAELKSSDTLIVLVKGQKVVLKGVNFEFNKLTLTKDSETILWRAYNAMVANPKAVIVITGHTDNVGSEKSNQAFSLKRAQAVKNWLVKKGIASNRMRTVGRGQEEPLASNDTEEGRAENRRMEFFVQ